MILALKTASDVTEIHLLGSEGRTIAKTEWQSGRQLAEGLQSKITELLERQGVKVGDLTGLIVFRGPGSFTGLRIGIATINAMAYGLAIPNASGEGEDWLSDGLAKLACQTNPQIVTPLYDRGPNTTQPRK